MASIVVYFPFEEILKRNDCSASVLMLLGRVMIEKDLEHFKSLEIIVLHFRVLCSHSVMRLITTTYRICLVRFIFSSHDLRTYSCRVVELSKVEGVELVAFETELLSAFFLTIHSFPDIKSES